MSNSPGAPPPTPTPVPPQPLGTADAPNAVAITPTTGNRRSSAQKKHQRILWDSDAATRDGKTSIGILLEWLATPGNYDRWRDGKTQFGETREALCSQIKAEMVRHGIFHRENANIRTQMSELERAYDNAVMWLVKNGYDGTLPDPAAAGTESTHSVLPGASAGNAVETQVLRTCRYFHTLDPIMRQASASRLALSVPASSSALPLSSVSPAATVGPRSRARPRASTRAPKAPASLSASDDKEQQQTGDSDGSGGGGDNEAATRSTSSRLSEQPQPRTTPTAANFTNNNGAAPSGGVGAIDSPAMAALAHHAAAEQRQHPAPTLHKRKAPSSASERMGLSNTHDSTGSVTVGATPPAPLPSQSAAPTSASAPTGAHPQALFETWQTIAVNPTAYESTQRLLFEAAREERDRKRFHMDEERSRLECERLRLEIQATRLRFQVERALARKQLAAAELSDAEIAAVLES